MKNRRGMTELLESIPAGKEGQVAEKTGLPFRKSLKKTIVSVILKLGIKKGLLKTEEIYS